MHGRRKASQYMLQLLLNRIAVLHTKIRPIVTDRVAWSVGLFVGHSH